MPESTLIDLVLGPSQFQDLETWVVFIVSKGALPGGSQAVRSLKQLVASQPTFTIAVPGITLGIESWCFTVWLLHLSIRMTC